MSPLYEVWTSHGEGLSPGPKFKLLEDAERYIASHCSEASHAVKAPDGHWAVIARRRIARGTCR